MLGDRVGMQGKDKSIHRNNSRSEVKSHHIFLSTTLLSDGENSQLNQAVNQHVNAKKSRYLL